MYQAIISKIQAADAVRAIGFYSTEVASSSVDRKIGVRVWEDQINQLNGKEIKRLVDELNAAIYPVADRWSKKLLAAASEELNSQI